MLDNLQIKIVSLTRVEYLGGVDIQLMAVAQRLKVNMSQGVSTLQLKNQHLPLKNGKGTLTLDFELGWVTKDNK